VVSFGRSERVEFRWRHEERADHVAGRRTERWRFASERRCPRYLYV